MPNAKTKILTTIYKDNHEKNMQLNIGTDDK